MLGLIPSYTLDLINFNMKKRDSIIVAAYSRQINLNVRVVKSKKDYDRKSYKISTKKEANLLG